jgi:hypothetical protein
VRRWRREGGGPALFSFIRSALISTVRHVLQHSAPIRSSRAALTDAPRGPQECTTYWVSSGSGLTDSDMDCLLRAVRAKADRCACVRVRVRACARAHTRASTLVGIEPLIGRLPVICAARAKADQCARAPARPTPSACPQAPSRERCGAHVSYSAYVTYSSRTRAVADARARAVAHARVLTAGRSHAH